MNTILLFIIGILMYVIDINIPTNILYPKYVFDSTLGITFQEYIVKHFVGDRVTIDLLPDAIGYILIIIGIILFVKYDKTIVKVLPLLGLLLAQSILLPIVPLLHNGKPLCYLVLSLIFFSVIFEMMMEYMIISRLIKQSDSTANKRNNVAIRIGLLVSMACKGIIFLTTFVGLSGLTVFYGTAYIISTGFYCIKLYGSRKYMPAIK